MVETRESLIQKIAIKEAEYEEMYRAAMYYSNEGNRFSQQSAKKLIDKANRKLNTIKRLREQLKEMG